MRRPTLLILGVAGALLAAGPAMAADVHPDVVNGREPATGEVASLIYVQADGYLCGGTLVAPTVVITAGHCATGSGGQAFDPSQVKVGYSATGSRPLAHLAVSQVVPEPDYNSDTYDNDIAVLVLAAPIANATQIGRAHV